VRTGKAAALEGPQLAHLLQQLPGTRVHADLAAFADFLLHRERVSRGDGDFADSVSGALDG
jgi:D-glycero-D-manno-heptose 1,7-bisphosphate phosphatase